MYVCVSCILHACYMYKILTKDHTLEARVAYTVQVYVYIEAMMLIYSIYVHV